MTVIFVVEVTVHVVKALPDAGYSSLAALGCTLLRLANNIMVYMSGQGCSLHLADAPLSKLMQEFFWSLMVLHINHYHSSMETDQGYTSLEQAGRVVLNRFSALPKAPDPVYERKLTNEYQRFESWASNLGLYHTGHSSLDYRFRDSPVLFEYAVGLLKDFEGILIARKSSSFPKVFELLISRSGKPNRGSSSDI